MNRPPLTPFVSDNASWHAANTTRLLTWQKLLDQREELALEETIAQLEAALAEDGFTHLKQARAGIVSLRLLSETAYLELHHGLDRAGYSEIAHALTRERQGQTSSLLDQLRHRPVTGERPPALLELLDKELRRFDQIARELKATKQRLVQLREERSREQEELLQSYGSHPSVDYV